MARTFQAIYTSKDWIDFSMFEELLEAQDRNTLRFSPIFLVSPICDHVNRQNEQDGTIFADQFLWCLGHVKGITGMI